MSLVAVVPHFRRGSATGSPPLVGRVVQRMLPPWPCSPATISHSRKTDGSCAGVAFWSGGPQRMRSTTTRTTTTTTTREMAVDTITSGSPVSFACFGNVHNSHSNYHNNLTTIHRGGRSSSSSGGIAPRWNATPCTFVTSTTTTTTTTGIRWFGSSSCQCSGSGGASLVSTAGGGMPRHSLGLLSLSSLTSRNNPTSSSSSLFFGMFQKPSIPLIVRGFASKKHKYILRHAKGYRGRSKNCFRLAIRRVQKAWQRAYKGRKLKKREWRKLWIARINAGARQYSWRYGQFIYAASHPTGGVGIILNRKVLSELALQEPFGFKSVIDTVAHLKSLPPDLALPRTNFAAIVREPEPLPPWVKQMPQTTTTSAIQEVEDEAESDDYDDETENEGVKEKMIEMK